MEYWLRLGTRAARRIVVAVVGGTVVLIGVAMLVLPGPALVVIPVGLGILGLEFAWARHWLRRIQETAAAAAARVTGSEAGKSGAEAGKSRAGEAAEGEGPGEPPASMRS